MAASPQNLLATQVVMPGTATTRTVLDPKTAPIVDGMGRRGGRWALAVTRHLDQRP